MKYYYYIKYLVIVMILMKNLFRYKINTESIPL